jgi:hypothetical protein
MTNCGCLGCLSYTPPTQSPGEVVTSLSKKKIPRNLAMEIVFPMIFGLNNIRLYAVGVLSVTGEDIKEFFEATEAS